jgi:hypothetical protein
MTDEYGTLTDYRTGESLRPATREEWVKSVNAGETGVFRDHNGLDLFVAGGPEDNSGELPAGRSG